MSTSIRVLYVCAAVMAISIVLMIPETAREGFAFDKAGTYGVLFGLFGLAVLLYVIRIMRQQGDRSKQDGAGAEVTISNSISQKDI